MFNIISKTKYAYIFSGFLVALSVFFISTWGLKLGIDFVGGTLMEVKFEQSIPTNLEIEKSLKEFDLKSLILQPAENNSMIIRYAAEDDKLNQKVFGKIQESYLGSQQLRVNFTNSSVSKELRTKSIWALFWAIIGIMAYVAYAFRKVSRPVSSWKYGAGAVIALGHDVLITVGAFSILGHVYGTEIGIPFIASLLTILGFSVHDTIVVYDRTRENLLKNSNKENFPEIVNRSLNETLTRSINTSISTLIVLVSIYFFGGDSIRDFALALIIGISFGTYSSIFVASALLVTSYKLQIRAKKV